MHFKLVLVASLFTSFVFLLCHHHFIAFMRSANPPAAAVHYISDAAINCGFNGNSTALDGREWIGDAPLKFLSGKSRISTAAEKPFPIDPVPYKTSRVSATEFGYSFEVSPGQKFIRLHLYPASYRGFENSIDSFTVKAGPFTLLRDFSASITAETSGVKYLIKEFCLNVEENTKLNITFSPSLNLNSKSKSTHAFVNGIEIISMPAGLYYTSDRDSGAPIVGQKNRYFSIDNSTALEVIQRLNIGGSSVSSAEDFGMFRRWNEDTKYLVESGAHPVHHPALRIKYTTNMPAFVAPAKLYQTSWKAAGNLKVDQIYNFTWKIPVELGFGYLIRLHFCDLDDEMAQRELREFSLLINNQIAETRAAVIRWSGGHGVPVYRDYMVKMKGDQGGSSCDLLIALQSANELVFGLLNGLEIFKLSNLDNSLAISNPTTPMTVSTPSGVKIRNVFLSFGHSNVVMTGMTLLVILVNVLVYYLRRIWEAKFCLENDTVAATTERACRCFSLAEIVSATQNFSDAFVIGRGGFGKVYKAYIPAIQEIVALKRLHWSSRQGAHEFWTEIETLSKLRHIHLVSLIGYCNESQEMILVYEYIPRGTLADNLYKMSRKGNDIAPLGWEQRLRICIGAARGLEYLHNGTEYGVIHRDVKDSNILLDENFVAKISDFGLSKLERLTQSKSYVSTKVKGTRGFCDPDYIATHRLTRKSDVYAFAVVLLVVLAGRPAVDNGAPEEQHNLVSYFRECIAEENVDRIVDPSLQGKFSSNSLKEFVKSIENCLHHQPKKRPTMAQVVASLEQALQQQESTMISASSARVVGQPFQEGTLESLQVLEESAKSPPTEGITSTSAELLGSPTRGQGYPPARKLLWGWPWKALLNRGKKQKGEMSSLAEALPLVTSLAEALPLYSYKALANATDHFHLGNMIGEACFGRVYKGILPNGQEIAVRRISNRHIFGEFKNEVAVASKLQHPNIVRLLGCCAEREEEKMLVYEYMPNKSLEAYLFDSKEQDVLDWSRRAIIIQGIGRALLYLHGRDSGQGIIHRVLNASHVLLDNGLNPKISNLSIGAFLGSDLDEYVTSTIRWTLGYMAPEYLLRGKFSEKTDIYSYGVLLLEIVSGKKNWQLVGCDLIECAWKLWNENKPKNLVDPALLVLPTETEILRCVHVGLLCVQDSPEDRPNVSTVLSMLNDDEIAELPRPKVPSYITARGLSRSSSLQKTTIIPSSDNDFSLTDIEGR
ncbi:receptor-like protein kinase FERONIA [Coffea eugenioides]|uniref:receptor-like protein kinase FERONIA n=1 Tax=Coffea eugenioides TaxID=49369 RepID=UPI000F605F02|nr:receptor-like protein kinase FERONIA [Coffea eugenioides]